MASKPVGREKHKTAVCPSVHPLANDRGVTEALEYAAV